jgi:hypothetical protein
MRNVNLTFVALYSYRNVARKPYISWRYFPPAKITARPSSLISVTPRTKTKVDKLRMNAGTDLCEYSQAGEWLSDIIHNKSTIDLRKSNMENVL